MAKKLLNLAAIAAICVMLLLPFTAFAANYTVGDASGWTNDFNYTNWVQGKTFYLGDNLVFNYEKGSHNVFKVNGTEFQQCKVLGNQTAFETGSDLIPLIKGGKKWYMCGVEGHCAKGQKLVITVMDQVAPGQPPLMPPPPPPASSSANPRVSGRFVFLLMALSGLGMAFMA